MTDCCLGNQPSLDIDAIPRAVLAIATFVPAIDTFIVLSRLAGL